MSHIILLIYFALNFYATVFFLSSFMIFNTIFRVIFLLLVIPTAAIVPSTVAIKDATNATIIVL